MFGTKPLGEFPPEIHEKLVKQLLENQARAAEEEKTLPPVEGEDTGLKCDLCGGPLVRDTDRTFVQKAEQFLVGRPRYSKKSRLRKKFLKKWEEHKRFVQWVSVMMLTRRPPSFRCKQCKKPRGFYQTIGMNMIKVEPMPLPNGMIYYLDEKFGKKEEL